MSHQAFFLIAFVEWCTFWIFFFHSKNLSTLMNNTNTILENCWIRHFWNAYLLIFCDTKHILCFSKINRKLVLAQLMCNWKCLSKPSKKEEERKIKSKSPKPCSLSSEFTEVLVIFSITLQPEQNCIDAQLCRYSRPEGAFLWRDANSYFPYAVQLCYEQTSEPIVLITPRARWIFSWSRE